MATKNVKPKPKPKPKRGKLEVISETDNGVNLPQSDSDVYNKFLKVSIGVCLPDIVSKMLQERPEDEIVYIATHLYQAADTQIYYTNKLNYLQNLRAIDEQLYVKKKKRENSLFHCSESKTHLNVQYRKARADERKLQQWIIDHQDLMMLAERERIKELKADRDSRRQQGEEFKLPTPTPEEEVDRILKHSANRLKNITAEILAEKKDRTCREIKNQATFNWMINRLKQAHIDSAMKENDDYSFSLSTTARGSRQSSKRASQSKLKGINAIPTKQFLEKKFPLPPLSTPSSSTICSSESDAPERMDWLQLTYEKMQATREMRDAVKRGDLTYTETGACVFVPKHWKSLGLKPTIKKHKKRCNVHTLKPPIWTEETFSCQVFYDPELYIRCDIEPEDLPIITKPYADRLNRYKLRRVRNALDLTHGKGENESTSTLLEPKEEIILRGYTKSDSSISLGSTNPEEMLNTPPQITPESEPFVWWTGGDEFDPVEGSDSNIMISVFDVEENAQEPKKNVKVRLEKASAWNPSVSSNKINAQKKKKSAVSTDSTSSLLMVDDSRKETRAAVTARERQRKKTGSKAKNPRSNTLNVDGSRSNTLNVDGSRSNTLNVDGSRSNTLNVDGSRSNTLNVDSSRPNMLTAVRSKEIKMLGSNSSVDGSRVYLPGEALQSYNRLFQQSSLQDAKKGVSQTKNVSNNSRAAMTDSLTKCIQREGVSETHTIKNVSENAMVGVTDRQTKDISQTDTTNNLSNNSMTGKLDSRMAICRQTIFNKSLDLLRKRSVRKHTVVDTSQELKKNGRPLRQTKDISQTVTTNKVSKNSMAGKSDSRMAICRQTIFNQSLDRMRKSMVVDRSLGLKKQSKIRGRTMVDSR